METKAIHQFFLVTPIHFEKMAEAELKQKAPNLEKIEVIKGGVQFDSPLDFGLELNYHLKIPTKILIRVGTFKARDFPKLFNSLLKLPWRQYLRQEIPNFHVTCKKSRLMNTDRIADVAKDSFERFNKMYPAKIRPTNQSPVTQDVYLRFEDDLCTASIDTSGERLHKRSYREFIGLAPIRENLAAGIISYTIGELQNQLQEKKTSLIDPLCGTGTFLAEAKFFNQANLNRGFNFEDFPSYRSSLKPLIYNDAVPWKDYLGADIDESIIKTNQKQLHDFGIEFRVLDALLPLKEQKKGAVIITNPPYGKRINIKGNPKVFFENLIETIMKNYQPMALGMLIPQDIPTPKVSHYKKNILLFKNGGIDIAYTLYISK